MKRLGPLLILLAASCSPAKKGGAATLSGNVRDPSSAPIANASIDVEGTTATSQAGGAFSLQVASGTRAVSVSALGFYPLHAQVPLAPGDNHADFTLMPCQPADASCATPTPTPSTTPTPPPDANITLTFSGTNYPGGGSQIPAHQGVALDNSTGVVWGDENIDPGDFAFTECYDGGDNPLGPGAASSQIAYCVIDYYRVGGASAQEQTTFGHTDDVLELLVDGPTWAVGSPDAPAGPATIRCSVGLATCSLTRYLADTVAGSTTIFFGNPRETATDGVADIVQGGYVSTSPTVQVANGAFTGLDFP